MFRRFAMALLLALATLVVVGQPAHAAPGRADGHRITLLIHGYDPQPGYNCDTYWSSAKNLLQANGWTDVYTFGYYSQNTNCTVNFNGSADSRIQEVGRQLAWTVYYFWSGHGVAIDIMGHSMGGLVARAAIEGVRRYGSAVSAAAMPQVNSMADVGTAAWPSGWPPYVYIEDVVTLGTPHKGAGNIVGLCTIGHEQCSDMRPGSGFISWLGGLKSSAMGTDYTLLGSHHDLLVSADSAAKNWDNDVSHAAAYGRAEDGSTISHDALRYVKTKSYYSEYRNLDDAGYGYYSPPLVQGMYGLYNHMRY